MSQHWPESGIMKDEGAEICSASIFITVFFFSKSYVLAYQIQADKKRN